MQWAGRLDGATQIHTLTIENRAKDQSTTTKKEMIPAGNFEVELEIADE